MSLPSPPDGASRSGAPSPFDDARSAGLAARRGLVGDARVAATGRAVRRLLDVGELTAPGVHGAVAASMPVHEELDVREAFDALRSRGWHIALPVVGEGRTMTFRLHGPGATTVPGRFGIPEPVPGSGADLSASELDVVVAPCVAVDRAGTRVGFGAGYYDRALADSTDRPVVVVAAFEVQVLDVKLPIRPWDVAADVVVTEQRTFRPSGTAARRGRGPAGDGSGGAPAR